MENPFGVPFAALNAFYFEEIVASMHISLQPLATDRRVLRHEAEESHITAIDLYQPQYSYIPWMLGEVFGMDSEMLLKIGKAWWLTVMDIVITDHAVDQQLPKIATIPLVQQHIRIHAERLYREAFGDSEVFWSKYHPSMTQHWNAVAHEVYCMEQHQQPYTYDEMKQVYEDKTAIIRALIAVMAEMSGKPDFVEPLNRFYSRVTLTDQLLDDASDWKDDFSEGRYTMPVVQALQSAGLPYENAGEMDEKALELLIDQQQVLVGMAKRAVELLNEAKDELEKIGSSAAHLTAITDKRLAVAEKAVKRYRTMRFLSGFVQALQTK